MRGFVGEAMEVLFFVSFLMSLPFVVNFCENLHNNFKLSMPIRLHKPFSFFFFVTVIFFNL